MQTQRAQAKGKMTIPSYFICSVSRLVLLGICLFIFVCLAVAAGEPAAPASADKVATLEGLVGQILTFELDEKDERLAWKEQQAQMSAMLKLLSNEKTQLKSAIDKINKSKAEDKTEQEKLAGSIAGKKLLLEKVSKAAAVAARKLLKQYRRLPVPLQQKLTADAGKLSALISGTGNYSKAINLLRAVAAFGNSMQEELSKIHLVKQVIEIAPDDKREADVLYLGGVVGFYLLPQNAGAGVLQQSKNSWKTVPSNEIAAQVEEATKIIRKEKPPVLVRLPLEHNIDKGVGDE